MSDIQTLQYQMSPGNGIIKRYQTDVNKKTGAYVTYDITNIGQKTAIFKSDPKTNPDGKQEYTISLVDSYLTTYNNLSSTDKNFLISTVGDQANNQRAAYITKNFTQDQINNLFQGMPKVQNTAPKSQYVTAGGTTAPAPTPPPIDIDNVNPTSLEGSISDSKNIEYNYGPTENLRYPLTRSNDLQDHIQFTMIRYGTRSLSAISADTIANTAISGPLAQPRVEKPEEKITGTVTLPIQPSISDSNGVDWGGANMNPVEAYFASMARGAMEQRGNVTDVLGDLLGKIQQNLKELSGNPDLQNALKLYLTQEAVGVQGLLSRTTGAILNPNLELLFNGPTLRPFNFTFRLSPRSKEEAANVRRIIRFFKQGMSVKTSSTAVFLKAPNVFDIKYISEGKDHQSLNRIKRCALLGCDVDYTPDGTYMTFNDDAKTMTSYQLSLRFSELEPLYEDDYKKLSSLDQIGY